ncbi:MAG TPA: phosphoribosylformylglycinamidine synthase subunit PurL, partial [Sedimentisphaerales bacterium]|nr:phosphoribosylformylglycinamidine synthase subunit PurL [Sedimentisphaerales bacterium]
MSHWRFEIWNRRGFADVAGAGVLQGIREIGIDSVKSVRSIRIFLVDADMDAAFARRVAEELLTDMVCEQYVIGRVPPPKGQKSVLIEVHLKSGVTDPVAQSVTAAIADMGVQAESVRTARKYFLTGEVTEAERDNIIRKVLANDCIEQVITDENTEPPGPHTAPYKLEIKQVSILGLDDNGLVRLSKAMDLFLNLVEMKAIQGHFRILNREPTDVELETLAQTWSEHCVHKTLKSSVELEMDGEKVYFDSLIKDTIFKATKDLNKSWCISVFEDNAGVIEFDEQDAVCFKVETHNHPSALDPYGGAATGVGGVVRDPMGTGLGSKPIANTDVFCFAPPDTEMKDVPKGVLHPRRLMKGVVAGVRDYGNRMGIPTVNGAICFDERYIANPLVFCGNVGIMPKDKCFKHPHVGDLVMVVGGRTGRDGIHGATFSSGEMTHEHEEIFSHAVQIGNAIVEKKMLDTLLQARDAGLFESVTDCGAGGLSSAVGEMGEKFGAEVDIDKVPLKYAGLSYTEIWISEAQERMVIAVKPENLEAISRIFAAEDVEATVIGRFTGDKQLTLRYKGQVVGRIAMDFLHNGVPKYARKAVWNSPKLVEPKLRARKNYTKDLLAILSSWNVASKEWVIRQYDHEVQGGSVIKPLVGAANDGPGDAAVIQPKFRSCRGLAISCGMNPLYGDIDPYWMAIAGIDEAIRNLVCVGADPERIAILDNFCWGDCSRPETFGSLVRAAQGCYDGALAFGTPFISGKDSLNNEFRCEDGTRITIPGTLLISAIGVVDDINKCVSMDLKRPGDILFVVGKTGNELGGSHYYRLKGQLGANVPRTDAKSAAVTARKLHEAMQRGLVAACHDCSEGGLAVALAEMAFAGGFGIEAHLGGLIRSADCKRVDAQLFSESSSRYVVEVKA